MFAGGIVLALTLMLFAVWLQRSEQLGWPHQNAERRMSEAVRAMEQEYLVRRRRGRRRVNSLFFLCGLLILIATFATPERNVIWLACWFSVIAMLLTIVVLAGVDVFRTYRYFRRRVKHRHGSGSSPGSPPAPPPSTPSPPTE